MKHVSTASLQSQISSQLNGHQQMKAIQSNQRCKHQQPSFWALYFGMHKVFCSSISLKKRKNHQITLNYWCIWRKKLTKMATNEEEKSALSPRQCTVSLVNHKNDKSIWIALWIASTHTLFSWSGPQQLLAICRPLNILQGKRFGPNEEVISETEMHFEAKEKLFYKRGIKLLEKHWKETVDE